MTHKDHRGMDAGVNACMKGLIKYAARHPNAQIVIFESVQQAYTQGLPLMRLLREGLEYYSKDKWTLYHVLHNGYSLGGSSIRKRYFWLAARIPFGIDPPIPTRVPALQDVIGDLEGMSLTWQAQPYRKPPTWWSKDSRSDMGVTDGHQNLKNSTILRNFDLITDDVKWGYKENAATVAKRHYDTHGALPATWSHMQEKILRKADPVTGEFRMGFIQPVRWHPERACRVITGGGMMTGIHPHEDRMFTHREVARIMGFPDDWKILPLRGDRQLAFYWGKGILTHCGKWIAEWAQHAMDGNPSDYQGEPLGDREYVFQYTNNHGHLSRER